MKDFKIFLSTDDWNAFLLPVKLKRIMAFCFETKIQKEGGIPLIPLNEGKKKINIYSIHY